MSDKNTDNQKDLIIQLKNGHKDSFKFLVELYQDKVLNTCYHFVHDKTDAEDLSQEVFLQVYRSIGRFREDAQLSTWIYRIAVNKSLDHIRKKKRKKRFAFVTSFWGTTENEYELQIPTNENLHSDLEQKEMIQILNNAINKLPENQKTAITLSKYEGFSNKEIAEILDTSVSSVESLIHRAKKNLNQKLYHFYEKNTQVFAG